MSTKPLLSHSLVPEQLSQVVADTHNQILDNTLLTQSQKEECLHYLKELEKIGFGQFLLVNKGLNGYWTQYLINYPFEGKQTGLNHEGTPLSEMERFLLEKAPVALATQQRAQIFKTQIQSQVKNGVKLASIPCGLMGDLLALDYNSIQEFQLTGVDMDLLSLQQAKMQAKNNHLFDHCRFIHEDAWNIKFFDEFDLISSNGLNIYVKEDDKLTKLYQRFFDALKPDGQLVISTLTPPPISGKKCEWDMSKINAQDLLKQTVIFSDIVGSNWQCFRDTDETKSQLASVGFKQFDCLFDEAKMMPTIIAYK